MREPYFWRALDPKSRAAAPITRLLLTPLEALYEYLGRERLRRTEPLNIGPPVICVGNLTLGGAGKTPVAAAVRRHLVEQGLRAATLSRGYGGRLPGPVKVDLDRHAASDVGDEPLMLAAHGESWIARRRADGAAAMHADGVEIVILDDGHQNPTLLKQLSLVVVDAAEPFGNGHVFPKGPLRERPIAGLQRADAVVLMGEGPVPEVVIRSNTQVLRCRLVPLAQLKPGRYVAFAGIGRPQRFFASLERQPGVEVVEAVPYSDHHSFTDGDLKYLERLSSERGANLVTTDKDHVRLPVWFRQTVSTASVEARFDDYSAFVDLLAPIAQSKSLQE